ncbi:MAG: T9SS type A sorting domain-containing protein [Bacteroidota bacterium]|nr:T9SS type A sorting domain-containing protein [Bacteroidota bacterium]
MKIKLLAAFLLAGIFTAYSLSQINLQLDHPVTPERDDSFLERSNFKQTASAETIRVLAVMVDFVEDTDARTSGNGKFDLSAPDSIIDSPPRNKNYFESHLQFLENYWLKVTNGKLIVKTTILDSVYHLSQKMQYYSPPKNSTTFSEIGSLVHEAWRLIDSTTPNIAFENFDAFCIFHAGVGRDVDLTSVYGYDPTPYDIPSIYFGLKNLQQIFGSSYQGVLVKGGQFHIKNSLVLPETENRLLPSIGGTSLLQLSINGLLAGTFGSYLGLPDLFNTKTGRTGIGRFGLMDGQSMFSWSGLFPPEPSAWEKYFLDKKFKLGSTHIVDVQPGENICDLPAVGLSTIDTIYRLPINAREYFLMENRNRDANRNGSTITFNFNGQQIQKYYQRDTTRYSAFNQRDVFGVVTDIDEFDWSLPGGVTKDGKFFDGGILIWHIDENVIDANYASNTINADPKRRGVDLEEADGSQDLGQSYGMLNPGSGSEDGTSLDFWFSGNSAPVYKNKFSQNTHPNSMSYDFANSYIAIKDFTERSPRMSAKVILGDDVVKPLPGYPKFIGEKAKNLSPQIIDNRIFISNGDSIFVFLPDGRSGTTDSNGLFSSNGGNYPLTSDGNSNFIGVKDSTLFSFKPYDSNSDSIFESIEVRNTIQFPSKITTSPIFIRTLDSAYIFIGCENGFIYDTSKNGFKVSNNKVTSLSGFYAPSVVVDWKKGNTFDPTLIIAGTSRDSVKITQFEKMSALPYISNTWEIATLGRSETQSRFYAVVDIGGNTLILFDTDLNPYKQINNLDGKISGTAISDLNNDGSRDVVVSAGRKIYAFNHNGFMLDHFPITVSDTVTSPPIIADVDGDGTLDVLVSTKNNLIHAYSAKGKSIFGFPISISNGATAVMSIAEATQTQPGILAAMSSDGYLYAWELPSVKSVTWGNYRGNVQHTASENSSLTGNPISEFFPTSRAYNWPNPVYDGKTNIRFYVRENSVATIKIFDMAGDLVDELRTNATGGIDNEVEWNASKVQSGVYYANIKVDGSGNSGSTIIKIAVVK